MRRIQQISVTGLFGIFDHIDEPEISLHVAWQTAFLNDLQQIIALSHFDVLMATHSPDIINDRWNLTVDLAATKEPTRHFAL